MRLVDAFRDRYREQTPWTRRVAAATVLLSLLSLMANAVGLVLNVLFSGAATTVGAAILGAAMPALAVFLLARGRWRLASNVLLLLLVSELTVVLFFGSTAPHDRHPYVALTFLSLPLVVFCVAGYATWQGAVLAAVQILVLVAYHFVVVLPSAAGVPAEDLSRGLGVSLLIALMVDAVLLVTFLSHRNALESLSEETVRTARALALARDSEARFRALFAESVDGLAVVGPDGRIVAANDALGALAGRAQGELAGLPLQDLVAPAFAAALADLRGAVASNLSAHAHARLALGAAEVAVDVAGTRLAGAGDEGLSFWRMRDLRAEERAEEERLLLEDRLRHSQKLEAIGRLAGAVAHDLNNLLTPVLGYSDLLRDELPAGTEQQRNAEQMNQAAARASRLVRQLLTFARRQVLSLKPTDVNAAVRTFEPILQRAIHERLRLRLDLAPGLGPVLADVDQLDLVLLNLVVNARDAMEAGTITVATGAHTDPAGAAWVELRVADEGRGMDEATRARIFEPFFTTKPGGTGLGLATVFGIVSQHRGSVSVESAPGRGTTFVVLLPVTAGAAPAADAAAEARPAGGHETILVVDDQAEVRSFVVQTLGQQGYKLLVAAHPDEAERLAAEHPGPIDLLLTDVSMPGMSGRELADKLRGAKEGLRVLYMSGYPGAVLAQQGTLDSGVELLQKPFTVQALCRGVRQALNGSGNAAAG